MSLFKKNPNEKFQSLSLKGDKAAQKQDFDKALHFYQQALQFDSTQPKLFEKLIETHKKIQRDWTEEDFALTLDWSMKKQELENPHLKGGPLKKPVGLSITILGLTGIMGSGKSTVSSLLSQKGIPVICADELARQALHSKGPLHTGLIALFGPGILMEDGEIDRKKVASLVFGHHELLSGLNALIHPYVIDKTLERIKEEELKGTPLMVLDVPLLFETSMDHLCDYTLVVSAPMGIIYERIQRRDRLSLTEVEKRLVHQIPLDEKIKRATYTIDNSGALSDIEPQLNEILLSLKKNNLLK